MSNVPKNNAPLMTAEQRREQRKQDQDQKTRIKKLEAERDVLSTRIETIKATKDMEAPAAKYQVNRLQARLDKVDAWLVTRTGPRPGMGRPVGIPNKVTANFRDEYLRSGKKSPIEFLLDVMNEEPRPRRTAAAIAEMNLADMEDVHPDDLKPESSYHYEKFVWDHKDRRIMAAIQVAPYIHPKLSSVEVGGHIGISHEDALSELE